MMATDAADAAVDVFEQAGAAEYGKTVTRSVRDYTTAMQFHASIKRGDESLWASQLGLGGFHQLEISSEIVQQVIDAYLAAGGNYIETAWAYGQGASEQKIGKALKGRRDQVILVSKSPMRDAAGIRRQLETSLENLQTDYLDFYFLHNVSTDEDFEAIKAAGGAVAALEQARSEGLIGGIGFSSHRPPMYLRALHELPINVILIWDNYLEEQYLPIIHDQIYPLAKEKHVLITAMKPLADGFLWRSAHDALRYVAGNGADVIVCGMNCVSHVEQAVAALTAGAADDDERARILRDAPELGQYVCRQCDGCSERVKHLFRCEGMCDRQMIDYLEHDPADYALRLRLHKWFGMGELAKQECAAQAWQLDALLADAANVECPYQIDIPRKIKLAWAKVHGDDLNRL